jgi:hypothetical protein
MLFQEKFPYQSKKGKSLDNMVRKKGESMRISFSKSAKDKDVPASNSFVTPTKALKTTGSQLGKRRSSQRKRDSPSKFQKTHDQSQDQQ